MIIVYSFIGKLPKYIIDTVHQSRLFFDGDIYLILDELNSKYLKKLEKYNVILIDYKEVSNNSFNKMYRKNKNKFTEYKSLGNRKMLFMRSIERFFLLYNFMIQKKIEDCLFLELDNLIYDNPKNWLKKLNNFNVAMMYDNVDRLSTGIMYVKNDISLKPLLNHYLDYIKNDKGFLSEMKANYYFYKKNKDYLHFLPIHWNDEDKPKLAYDNYNLYNSIFDSAAIGIFLFGNDMIHTNNKLVKGKHNKWSKINYTKYKFIWKHDEFGRKRPYIRHNDTNILINNLHIHSKQLHLALSK